MVNTSALPLASKPLGTTATRRVFWATSGLLGICSLIGGLAMAHDAPKDMLPAIGIITLALGIHANITSTLLETTEKHLAPETSPTLPTRLAEILGGTHSKRMISLAAAIVLPFCLGCAIAQNEGPSVQAKPTPPTITMPATGL